MAQVNEQGYGISTEPTSFAPHLFNRDGGGGGGIVYALRSVTMSKGEDDDNIIFTWKFTGTDGSQIPPIVQKFPKGAYIPLVVNGVLSWSNNMGLPNPDPVDITGPQGRPGKDGTDGKDGPQGSPGFSPTIAIQPFDGGHRLTVTTAYGVQEFDIADGSDGNNGISPAVTVTAIEGGNQVTIIDATGSKSFNVMNGTAGISPVVSVADIEGGHAVTITDVNGDTTFNVMDGATGKDGTPGENGKDAAQPTPTVDITAEGDVPGASVSVEGTESSPIWHFSFTGIKSGGGGGTGGEVPAITMSVTIAEDGGETRATVERTGSDEAPNFNITIYNIKGDNGTDGTNGADGFSPVATVSQTDTGATINITDKKGETTADIKNGKDGVSPTIMSTEIEGGHRVDMVDAEGSESFDVMNGQDGADGFSPVVTLSKVDNGVEISVTNKDGVQSQTVENGGPGPAGPTGTTPEITITAKQGSTTVPVNKSGSEDNPNFDFQFPEASVGGTWGYETLSRSGVNWYLSRSIKVKQGTPVFLCINGYASGVANPSAEDEYISTSSFGASSFGDEVHPVIGPSSIMYFNYIGASLSSNYQGQVSTGIPLFRYAGNSRAYLGSIYAVVFYQQG